MTRTMLYSDGFGGADVVLNAHTLDNAFGGAGSRNWNWLIGNEWNKTGGRAVHNGSPAIHLTSITASPIGDCRVAGLVYGNGVGIVARIQTAGGVFNYYMGFAKDGTSSIYQVLNFSFVQIASGGAGFSDADEIALTCVGTGIALEKNTSTILSATDSAIDSGIAGLYSEGLGAGFSGMTVEGISSGGGGGKLWLPAAMRRHDL